MRTIIGFLLSIGLMACQQPPVKHASTGAATPLNYGCQGTSLNDCIQFHTPDQARVQ